MMSLSSRYRGLKSRVKSGPRRTVLSLLALCGLGLGTVSLLPSQAQALGVCICDGCICTAQEFSDNAATNSDLHNETRFDEFGSVLPLPFYAYDSGIPIQGLPQGTERMGEHQEFLWNLFFGDTNTGEPRTKNFVQVWMHMAQQMTTVAMWHTFTIGTFLDAKIQLETQAVLQERRADIHKRYQPSVGMCVFGTNVRSLAAAEHNGKLVAHTLQQRLIDRLLGTEGASGMSGSSEDQRGRVRYFLAHVCDRFDNNRLHDNPATGFANICQDTTPRTTGTVNLDLDFTRLIMLPRTIDVDFAAPNDAAGNNLTRHVFNLGANLFGHKIPALVAVSSPRQTGLQSQVLDIRSAIAKRSVAQTSYSALVGLKARGTENSNNTLQYMSLLLEELGMPQDEIADYLARARVIMRSSKFWPKSSIRTPISTASFMTSPITSSVRAWP